MILKILTRLSYLILIFGLFYGTYHFGMMKGKKHERIHGENVVLMSDCFESSLFTKCTHTHMNSEPIKRLYQEVLNELRDQPASAGDVGSNKTSISSISDTTPPDSYENKKLSMK